MLAFVIYVLKINLEVCTFDDVIAFVVNNASKMAAPSLANVTRNIFFLNFFNYMMAFIVF